MSDVVRKVTIQLQIQQAAFKPIMPDMSPVITAAGQIDTAYEAVFKKIESQCQSAADKMKALADTASSVNPGAPPTAGGGASTPPDKPDTPLSAPEKAAAAAEKTKATFASLFQSIAAGNAAARLEFSKTWKAADDASRAIASAEARSSITNNMLAAGDAYKTAGEGAFTLVRGIALLNIESDDELAKVVKKIAYYQGMFDVFKGGLDIVKGLYVGTKALSAAYAVSAAAAAVNTGATSAMSVAMAVATGWATAMWTAITGPVGVAVLAITAVIGLGALAWYQFGGASEAAAAKMTKQVKHLDDVRAAQYRLIAANRAAEQSTIAANSSKRERDFEGGLPGDSAQSRIDRLRTDQKKLHEQQIKGLLKSADFSGTDAYLGQSSNVSTAQGTRKNADQFGELNGTGFASFMRNASQADRIRKMAENVGKGDAAAIKSGTKEDKNAELERVAAKEKATLEAALAGENALKAAAEQRLAVKQEVLAALDQERTRLEDMLKLEEDRYKSAQNALKAEAQKNLSQEEKFGRMTQFDQQRAIELAKRVKSDGVESLRKDEVEFLEQNGLAEGKISRHYINRGQAALQGTGAFEALGEGTFTPQQAAAGEGSEGDNRAAQAQQMADNALDSMADTSDQIAEIKQQHDKEIEEYRALLKELGNLEPLIETLQSAIEERDRQLENMKVALKESIAATQAEETRVRYANRQG